MKAVAYPVVIMEDNSDKSEWKYLVNVPDFGIYTEGRDIADAIEMARDAIGAMGIAWQDQGKKLPVAGTEKADPDFKGITTYVDIDFEAYRKEVDMKAVRKNCTIPSYLNTKAEREGINFSQVLQDALIAKLGLA